MYYVVIFNSLFFLQRNYSTQAIFQKFKKSRKTRYIPDKKFVQYLHQSEHGVLPQKSTEDGSQQAGVCLALLGIFQLDLPSSKNRAYRKLITFLMFFFFIKLNERIIQTFLIDPQARSNDRFSKECTNLLLERSSYSLS